MLFCKILSISSRWQENQYFSFPAGKPSASEQEQRGRGETRRLRSRDWSARRPTGLVWWVNFDQKTFKPFLNNNNRLGLVSQCNVYNNRDEGTNQTKKHSNWSKHACKPKLMHIHWENTHLDSSPIVLSIPVFCQKNHWVEFVTQVLPAPPDTFPIVFQYFQYSSILPKKSLMIKCQVLLAPPDTFPRRCWRRSHMGSRLISGHVVSFNNHCDSK